MQSLRRAAQKVPRLFRGMSDDHHHGPPAHFNPNLHHVFGDDSYRLPYNFEPMPLKKSFPLTIMVVGILGLPVWLFMYEDYKMEEFKEKLAAARKKKDLEA